MNKVLSFLEACFDLISSPSLSMKIQIMGGKITENLGFLPLFCHYFRPHYNLCGAVSVTRYAVHFSASCVQARSELLRAADFNVEVHMLSNK